MKKLILFLMIVLIAACTLGGRSDQRLSKYTNAAEMMGEY